jgi:hypothetical protein
MPAMFSRPRDNPRLVQVVAEAVFQSELQSAITAGFGKIVLEDFKEAFKNRQWRWQVYHAALALFVAQVKQDLFTPAPLFLIHSRPLLYWFDADVAPTVVNRTIIPPVTLSG